MGKWRKPKFFILCSIIFLIIFKIALRQHGVKRRKGKGLNLTNQVLVLQNTEEKL